MGIVLFDWSKLENEEHIIRYFTCMREFIVELEKLNDPKVSDILKKYYVSFVDADKYPRVNFDFPGTQGQEGK